GQSADGARRVLRLFITSPSGSGGTHRDLQDIEVQWNHGRRYLHVTQVGAHLRVAVGLLSQEGYFAPIAHSSLVRLPPAGPSGDAGALARRAAARAPLPAPLSPAPRDPTTRARHPADAGPGAPPARPPRAGRASAAPPGGPHQAHRSAAPTGPMWPATRSRM